MLINRADYKAIKHMDREKMSDYLQRLYKRGYEAGVKAGMATLRINEAAPVEGTADTQGESPEE